MHNNVSKHDHLWDTEDFKKKYTSIYNNPSKQDHLWDRGDFKKNVCLSTIMH